MIDFMISIDDCAGELDSRQSWKIRYPLINHSISCLCLSVSWD